jgi:hypothetical protein
MCSRARQSHIALADIDGSASPLRSTSDPPLETSRFLTARICAPYALGGRVIVSTIYDPSDRDDDVGRRELALSRLATIALRRRLNAVNDGIGELASEHRFLLADLERLFHGHGVASNEPWLVNVIEPNLAGATAIGEHWYDLLTSR